MWDQHVTRECALQVSHCIFPHVSPPRGLYHIQYYITMLDPRDEYDSDEVGYINGQFCPSEEDSFDAFDSLF